MEEPRVDEGITRGWEGGGGGSVLPAGGAAEGRGVNDWLLNLGMGLGDPEGVFLEEEEAKQEAINLVVVVTVGDFEVFRETTLTRARELLPSIFFSSSFADAQFFFK